MNKLFAYTTFCDIFYHNIIFSWRKDDKKINTIVYVTYDNDKYEIYTEQPENINLRIFPCPVNEKLYNMNCNPRKYGDYLYVSPLDLT